MDPRNYKDVKHKRINPETKLGDVNELNPDFELQLKDGIDDEGETYPINVKVSENVHDQKKLDKVVIIKTSYDKDFNEVVEKLTVDDMVCDEFSGKKKYTFIFSLNGLTPFHVYNYTIMLTKGYEMTVRRMYKIICQSAIHVLEDTLEYLRTLKNVSEDTLFDVKQKFNELEVDYIGVKLKGNVIYVGYAGFEMIDPRNTL